MFLGLAILKVFQARNERGRGMDTAHRRMEIISILSVKGHITARELAWELGVTIRTIHHDIFALTFDYPIYTKPGCGGGVFITENYKLTKQEKTTDIGFDEKDPLIHIRTRNTDLKKCLAAYAGQYPGECRQTDTDPETGCMEFEIAKGRFSFRLTAPYSEERRRVASKAAKAHSNNLLHPSPKV